MYTSLALKSKKRIKTLKSAISKRRRNPKGGMFSLYIYRLLRDAYPNVSISGKAMDIMNNFLEDIFNRIATEASSLMKLGKTGTLTSREIQTAARLVIPGELSRHATLEGQKAVVKYLNSKFSM